MGKKSLALFLSLIMVLSVFPMSVFAAEFTDMPDNWSRPALEKAVANGLLKGDKGKIRAEDSLTRAEMATIVNRSFQSTKVSSLKAFLDVKPKDWYYKEMGKAVGMQTFKGTGDKLYPNDNITREEAFVVLARAFKISEVKKGVLDKFSDKNQLSTWAKNEVSALVSAGYISGLNGQINPKANITRSEFAQVMDNLVKTYITKEGTYNKDYKGNLMINQAGVTLKGLTIDGDLIIGDGVGDGDITLDEVTLNGRLVVRGGGEKSIKIIGKSNIKKIMVARVDGIVRVYTETGVEIGEVIVDGNDDVILEGEFDSVRLMAEEITVFATNTNIESAEIVGRNSKIILGKDSSIDSILVSAGGVKIEGQGKIKEVLANGNNIVVTVIGTKVTQGYNGKGAMAGDKEVLPGKTEIVGGKAIIPPSQPTSSGGGGTTKPTDAAEKLQAAKAKVAKAELLAATEAVATAETTKTNETRTAAQILVTALPDGAEKTALQGRIAVIVTAEDQADLDAALAQAKISKKSEIDAVVLTAEEKAGKTTDSIESAKNKLTELKNTAKASVEAALTVEVVNEITVSKAEALVLLVDQNNLDIEIANTNIATAKTNIEAATYTAAQADASNETNAKIKAQALVDALVLEGTRAVVVDGPFTAAIAGAVGSPDGTNGSYTFTVTINKSGGTQVTSVVKTMTITATSLYVMATDVDFDGTVNGDFKYIGTGEYVEIPHVIKGVNVTSYKNMFLDYDKSQLKGVKSTNANVEIMGSMFEGSQATSLDLSKFDTSKVMDMNSMFNGSQATSLNLSSFDTSKVQGMNSMFMDSQATSLDLSKFDTSKVQGMNSMFMDSQATSLDLSSFDTSQVTSMHSMFNGSQATSLDLSSFNTSQVIKMWSMFKGSQATSLDLSKFNTSQVTEMNFMFEGSQATSLDLSKFDTSKVTNMQNMFCNSSPTSLDLSSFDTSKVTNMSSMFKGSQATSLDLSKFDTSKVTNMWSMFKGSQTTSLDLSKFNTSQVTNMSSMFEGSQATSLDLSKFNTSQVINMWSMFEKSQATSLDLSSFDTSKVTNMISMFEQSQATSLDLSSFDTSKVTIMESMFYGSQATMGYARTQADVNKFNSSSSKPEALTFTVK